jgi:hypothetical protein
MGVPDANMPDVTVLQYAYDTSLNIAYDGLKYIPCQPATPSIYAIAVYNLGGAVLVDIAQDTPPDNFWDTLRDKLGINTFVPGYTTSASDQGTSQSMTLLQAVQNFTMLDAQLAKSPWGRMYLQLAGEWGTIWGLTA